MLVLGFASGIPYQLVYITQSAWLYEAKVPIAIIGMMSELTLAYKFKFVWSPFLDRYDAPLFSRLLGRRRGWIVVSQIAIMAALAGIALGDPAEWLAWTIAFSLALGFAGATQDVVVDGWRINVGSDRTAGADGVVVRGRLSHRRPRRGRRRPPARRPVRMARSLFLHGGADDGRNGRGLLRPRAGSRQAPRRIRR